MKVTRQTVIERRQELQRKQMNKKIMKTVNACLVMFASTTALSNVAAPKTVAHAQDGFSSRTDFLSKIGNFARDIAAKNDLYASVMIAQAILESGWGQSGLAQAPHHNLFGIKGSYNGNSVNMDTLEDDGTGRYYNAKEPFRSYANYGESLSDYASILTGDNDQSSWRYNFYYGARVSQTNSYEDATRYLTGRYATDTRYGSKLNRLIADYNLSAYDNGSTATPNPAAPAPSNGSGGYTVKAGDSYWKIANQYGISIAELQRLNGTNSYTIHPGQVLKVPGSSSSSNTASTSNTTNNTSSTNSGTTSAGGGYTVKAGDSYWKIANQYGISIAELQRLNGTNSYMIHPGQVLKVPGSSSSSNTASTSNTTNSTSSANSGTASAGGGYTVKPGDSYWKIANQYGISIAELQRLNGTNSYMIHPGQVLKVPGSSNASNTASTSNTTNSTSSTNTGTTSTGGGYTVKPGDSYWKIANQYGISIAELQRLNGTNSYTIHPGQVLKVPGSGGSATIAQQAPATPAPTVNSAPTANAGSGSYTVQAGDSYWKIANRYGMSISQLQQLNGRSDYFLYPGQTIRVSGTAASTVEAPQAQTPAPTRQAEQTAPAQQAAPAAPQAQTSGGYVVKPGDTLYSIAQRYGVDVYKLIANNGGSAFIQVGQVVSFN